MSSSSLVERYLGVRAATEALCAHLSPEDQLLQSQTESSPTKWHRAHTSWFFETFLLQPSVPDYTPVHPAYRYLFNSYYNGVGDQHPRPIRGLLSRPDAHEVSSYRKVVDARMTELLMDAEAGRQPQSTADILATGLTHEEQHQELILTDILHAFSFNPMLPAVRPAPRHAPAVAAAPQPLTFEPFAGGLVSVGHAHGRGGFALDNEMPSHQQFLRPFGLARRLVTVGEYCAFINAGGYQQSHWWLSDGWDCVRRQNLTAPLHWHQKDGAVFIFTPDGLVPAQDDAPVAFVSFYEADAYARFAGARLPTEAEWEHAAVTSGVDFTSGNDAGTGWLRPRPAPAESRITQMHGDVWEWTQSAYSPYPGFRPAPGNLGEYNGKFMVSQMVLRGGSCFTPPGHVRPTYRNFWSPPTRFQCTGIRLARDAA